MGLGIRGTYYFRILNGKLQKNIIHPQRWTDKPLPWLKELVWQNVKNVPKYYLLKTK